MKKLKIAPGYLCEALSTAVKVTCSMKESASVLANCGINSCMCIIFTLHTLIQYCAGGIMDSYARIVNGDELYDTQEELLAAIDLEMQMAGQIQEDLE